MKGLAIKYSREELAWIESHKTMVRKVAHALFCKEFNRDDVKFDHYKSLCLRKGWKTGRTGRVEKGTPAWNKGKSYMPGGKCSENWFKKGSLPHNTKYAGHERISIDGYIEISIDETNPHTGFERRYVQKHRHIWESINGEIPEGYVLKFIDSDKTNCDISNLELIRRSVLLRLNQAGYDNSVPELKPIVMGVSKLKAKLGELNNA